MWYRRLLWAAALTAALLFQITNDNYLGRFLLALCVAGGVAGKLYLDRVGSSEKISSKEDRFDP